MKAIHLITIEALKIYPNRKIDKKNTCRENQKSIADLLLEAFDIIYLGFECFAWLITDFNFFPYNISGIHAHRSLALSRFVKAYKMANWPAKSLAWAKRTSLSVFDNIQSVNLKICFNQLIQIYYLSY